MPKVDHHRASVHVALSITALHGISGGAERVLVDVANGLFRRGFQVTVFTTQDQNGVSFYPLDYGIRQLDGKPRHAQGRAGARLSSLSAPAQRRRWLAVALWLLRYGPRIVQLRRLLRAARPDVVIGFLPSSFTYLQFASLGLPTKRVASLHNVPERDLGGDPDRWDQNPVDVWARRRALRKSDANTVLLPSFLEQLETKAQQITRVIPNMIHPYDGQLADAATGETNALLAVGRLSPAKDHETLIRAWAMIQDRHPAWSVRIIGEGPLFEQLSELVVELGVERLAIENPTSEIEAAYTSSKLFVLPSLYEGFGLVTVEAMSCGLPVIGFADCEGTNEIVIDGENGKLVEPAGDRVAALSDALSELIRDDDQRERLGANGPETAATFAPAPVLDAWEELILSLVNEAANS